MDKKVEKLKEAVQADGKVISFGSRTGTKNFVDETSKAIPFGFTVTNTTDEDVFVVLAPGYGMKVVDNDDREIFNEWQTTGILDKDKLLSRTGADAILSDGVIHTGARSGSVTVSTNDSRRKLEQVTRYADVYPLRITKMVFDSQAVSGGKESTNYNNRMKSVWVSPFEDTVDSDFDLSSLKDPKNYQENILTLDFQKHAPSFKAIISRTNFLVMKINKGTILNVNMFIGAQLDLSQWLYRFVTDADNAVSLIRGVIRK